MDSHSTLRKCSFLPFFSALLPTLRPNRAVGRAGDAAGRVSGQRRRQKRSFAFVVAQSHKLFTYIDTDTSRKTLRTKGRKSRKQGKKELRYPWHKPQGCRGCAGTPRATWTNRICRTGQATAGAGPWCLLRDFSASCVAVLVGRDKNRDQ